MSDDLLPCPFCGGRRTNICATYYEPEDREAFAVTCRTKDCHGVTFQLGYGLFDTREKAVAAWNTRLSLTEVVPEPQKTPEDKANVG